MLIGVADVCENGAGSDAAGNYVLHVEAVVRVGRLKPGTTVIQIQVDRVGRRYCVIDAVEDVLLVSLVVEDGELGGIEKAASVEAVGLNEVAPLRVAIGEIESGGRRTEGAIGGIDAAGGLGDALAGARGGHDDEIGR